MNTTVQSNISDLNKVLIEHQKLSGLSAEDVLSKQGGKLARSIYRELFATKKPAGSIRAAILARLKAGKMIHLRPSAYDFVAGRVYDRTKANRKNVISGSGLSLQQQVVAREISIRESGRGVLAQSSRYSSILADTDKAVNRAGFEMSEIGLKIDQNKGYVKINWTGVSAISARVVKGLMGDVPENAIKNAIQYVREDILVYVRRKQAETVAATVKAMVGPFKTLSRAIS